MTAKKQISEMYDLSLIERLDVVRRHPKLDLSRNKSISAAMIEWCARKEQEYLIHQASDNPKPLEKRKDEQDIQTY